MSEGTVYIAEELMLARIAQSEQMREFFVQMWQENPQFAVRAGSRVKAMMAPLAVSPAPTFSATSPHHLKTRL